MRSSNLNIRLLELLENGGYAIVCEAARGQRKGLCLADIRVTMSLTIPTTQTAPFLIRAFIKVGGFHRLTQFEDVPLPIVDEQQIFTWYASLLSIARPSSE